jgi:predicted PurR-regulated permease PerM
MERSELPIPRTIFFFITFAAVGIGVWFLHSYASLFNSFFLAIMIVMTASPMGFWLRNHGAPDWLALLLSVLVALAATVFIALVIAIASLRVLQMVPAVVADLSDAEQQAAPFLGRFGITLGDLQTLVPPAAVGRVAAHVIQLTLSSVSMFGLVILIVVFMVIEAFLVPLKLSNSPRLASVSPDIAIHFTLNIRQYVGITSLLGLIGGIVLGIVLMLLHIPFAFLWGVLYLVLNFVPMVGFWFAVIPPMLLAAQTGGAGDAVIVLGAYMIVSTIINQAVKPAVMRGGLDLSPFWSIMSLIVWSTILGPVGLIIGVPLTIALKELVFSTDKQAYWVADLLGAGLPQPQAAPYEIPQALDDEEASRADTDTQ